jgi:ribosomal protein S18 acetylase RimI-like enzyme
MNKIIKATEEDCKLLCKLAETTFIESHGSSASEADIQAYIKSKYNEDVFRDELTDGRNIYHIIYYKGQAAGFSKIILNATHSNITINNVTKLERLYILKDYYDQKLGLELFEFNKNLSLANKQVGIWLFVWKENERAIKFYQKANFKIIGSHDFAISETHSNPNHQMLLLY